MRFIFIALMAIVGSALAADKAPALIGVGYPCKADGSAGNCASGFCLASLFALYRNLSDIKRLTYHTATCPREPGGVQVDCRSRHWCKLIGKAIFMLEESLQG
ncbi:hypothetical protein Pdw03_8321 [Penicillium digitatum]|uniref:Uncharacterized protein n=1 Tax=Penicillium digitatum TaxID=36651 RepID=A0A7T7BLP5_PENDI|nr:hypothetical protein PDIDSM_4438 [Penicillium digitatum]QQK44420.1 hypothetical protein Pdw03_8321 [Penicillium digitatum]